jgi:aryl carrier-like protein
MISFKDFLLEDITEQEVDELIESLEWEDVIELFDTENMIVEGLSSTERIKMGQKMRSRKTMLAMARNVKLRRPAPIGILKGRSKVSARKLLTKKLLKGKAKGSLSASEKSRIEARVSMMMSTMKNLPAKLLPKIRDLERNRLMDKGKK